MNLVEALLLGLIQGLTEFLPVSSSGHLVIFQDLLGLKEPGVTLEVILHFATALSVICVFGRDFFNLLRFWKDKEQKTVLLMLILGIIPTAVFGLLGSAFSEVLFKSTLLVGFMLLITGLILKLLSIIPVGEKTFNDMKPGDALVVGLLQGLAVIPGISRSGSTIAGSLWRGLNRETAVKYSFMLSVPVIFGATLTEIDTIASTSLQNAMVYSYLIGGAAAFLAGIVAIKIFIRLLTARKFHYFAYYCWVLGSIIIIFSLL
ncbi:MAG: undecaprenyl-diphosphate phosphatase [Bacillota bacterium]|nr:undecaprenyl-diphosphate phosphatase [Bacillota bacterium]